MSKDQKMFIVINPFAQAVGIGMVEGKADLLTIARKVIGCETISFAHILQMPDGNILDGIIDDEGLLKPIEEQAFFTIGDHTDERPLYSGIMMLVSSNPNTGESGLFEDWKAAAVAMAVDLRVQWHTKEYAQAFALSGGFDGAITSFDGAGEHTETVPFTFH